MSAEFRVRSAKLKTNKEKSSVLFQFFFPHFAFRTSHSKGFTLLEVMAAVAILGLVLVTLLALQNRATKDVMYAERLTTATMLARRLMVETLPQAKTVMEDNGQYEEEEFKDYGWKTSVSTTDIPDLMEVRAAVIWKEGEREEMVELVSYE